jgi:hypothetical protein
MSHPYALTDDQRGRFARDGHLLLPGLLPAAVLDGLRSSFSRVVDQLAARWHDSGLIPDTFPDLPFDERYLRLVRSSPVRVPAAWRRVLVSRPVYDLWRRPELLGAVRSVLGDEIYAHGVWNGRPRDPCGRTQQVSWHQDAYYYKGWDPAVGPLLSVWIPLVPVDEQRACMQFVTGSHTSGWLPRIRLDNGEYGTDTGELDGAAVYTARMEPGDVVVFTDTTLHRSTPNVSDRVRWSIDIRFGRTVPGVVDNAPRGYRCFSAADPGAVESFETWARRYRYEPEELLVELTNFEEGYDLEALRAFSRASPYADIY